MELRIRSGALGKWGIRETGITNHKRRIMKSDNRTEARGRMLGREKTAMRATDTVTQCVKRHWIGAAVIFNNAVGQELNILGKGSMAARAMSGVTALRQASSENTILRGSIVTTEKQNAAYVGGPNRGSRMAVAGIGIVAAVHRMESDRRFGG